MNIYTAIDMVPARIHFRKPSKFLRVWQALSTVPEGKYLPVECRSTNEATYLTSEAKSRGLSCSKRGKIVYLNGVANKPFVMADEPSISVVSA